MSCDYLQIWTSAKSKWTRTIVSLDSPCNSRVASQSSDVKEIEVVVFTDNGFVQIYFNRITPIRRLTYSSIQSKSKGKY